MEYDAAARRLTARHVSAAGPMEYAAKGEHEWTACFEVNGVDLPPGYFVGLSASTGDLSDNHDLLSLLVYGEEGAAERDVADDVRAGWAA